MATPGATGFGGPPVDIAADLRTFATMCHAAARAAGGTVTGVTPAGPTPNFHTAEIRHRDQRVAVLRHVVLPVIAFAHPAPRTAWH